MAEDAAVVSDGTAKNQEPGGGATDAAPAKTPTPCPPDPGRNLVPQTFVGELNSANGAIEHLKVLAHRLEQRAIATIDWYLKKKRVPQLWSQWIRALAIGLAIVGGMMPLISGALPATGTTPPAFSLDRLGYLFIAAAAAILMTDRYFGFSTAWMRYMTAQMALQRALEKFQLAWGVWQIRVASGSNLSGAPAKSLSAALANDAVNLLSNFQKEVGELVDQEFQLWVAEFKEQLATLQSAVTKEKEDQRPGNVVVNISSGAAVEGPSQIYVDSRLIDSTSNSAALLFGIVPGSHLVTVKAKAKDGKHLLEGSQFITVSAGQTAKADVTLSVAPS